MTLSAIDLSMSAKQWIIGLRLMVKIDHWRPSLGHVASVACLGKLALMKILMTVATGRIDGFEVTITVATRAVYGLVLPRAFEATEFFMLEGLNFPVFKAIMAAVTRSLRKLITVHIRMTERAVGERIITGLAAGRMTAITRLFGMSGRQIETGHRMVKARP